MKSMMIKIALPLLLLGGLAVEIEAAGVVFPGLRFAVSPDSLWVVNCRGAKKQGYLLEVSKAQENSWRQFFLVGRWCEVLWEGGGSHVALTDWGSGRGSDVILIDLAHPQARMPLSELIPGMTDSLRQEERGGVLYWEALRWDADTLTVRAFGHTRRAPAREFAYEFHTVPARRTWTLVGKDNGINSRAETRIRSSMRLGGRPDF